MSWKVVNRFQGALPRGLSLALILLVGLGLRLWQLDGKPLWLDEVISALFSLGRSYRDVPLDVLMPFSELDSLFTFQPGVTCAQIAQTVTVESVHPPLFFCLMYHWMGWLSPIFDNWVWSLRGLPALLGVGAIAALYHLNRIAFSRRAGLVGAALMAVSPFAVYLSQEARHYTLPMLLITLALAGLIQIQRDLERHRLRPALWIGWMGLNSLGLYVHYFCALALVAQILALAGWLVWQRQAILRAHLIALGLAIAGIILAYLPWLPTMVQHLSRPETDWLEPYDPQWIDRLAPFYQIPLGWILMVICLPVEGQPLAIAIPSILIMLLFSLWVAYQVVQGIKYLWQEPTHRSSLILLSGFIVSILLQFLAIVYVLNKDLTAVPRYNFIYYPAFCALLGAALGQGFSDPAATPSRLKTRRSTGFVLLAGILSSLTVVYGLAFQKSYYPDQVAAVMARDSSQPIVTIVSYQSLQEVALGLSFALALREQYPGASDATPVRFGFVSNQDGNAQFWRNISQIYQPLPLPLHLWVVASPSVKMRQFPPELRLIDPAKPTMGRRGFCTLEPDQSFRLGFPYQRYQCEPRRRNPA